MTPKQKRNAQEQKSRDRISKKLNDLKKKIPLVKENEADLLTKHRTLILAKEYIAYLSRLLEDPDEHTDFRDTVKKCLQTENSYSSRRK